MKAWLASWNPPLTDEGDRRLLFRVLLLSLLLHVVTAWFSVGYQAADEQFQILEFLAHKLGWAPAGDLPLEFHNKMRPWLQPAIYFGIARFWETLGITDSHFWAFTFRLFAGFAGWLSCVAMALCAREWFIGPLARRLAIWCAGVLWYLPALHVRPSSESLAGSAFTLGVCLLTWAHLGKGPDLLFSKVKWTPRKLGVLWLLGGACWGLAFESRYQAALMAVGGWLWFAFYSRARGRAERVRELGLILAGSGAVFALGRVADRWGFGDWSFTPWNYANINLIHGLVSQFGQEPWWEIFRVSVTESWPILGILFALLVIVAWVRHPRHVLTWCHIPFFLVHEIIKHKEYRFFFPIGSAGPILVVLALSAGKGELDAWLIGPARRLWATPRRVLVKGLIALNAIALISLAFVPFSRNIRFQQEVYREFRRLSTGPADSRTFELFTPGRDPFRILGNPIHFYRPRGLEVKRYASTEELVNEVRSRMQDPARELPVWIFEPSFAIPPELEAQLPECKVTYRTLPAWLIGLRQTSIGSQLMARVNVFTLYRCAPSR